ncbi:MAG TPA: hypothetical protein VFL47_03365, partial [Flavisolibacter sp.]|nr:hypothetical protein [Flavisolibacter sp.]
MKKQALFATLFLFVFATSFANHITGGEMFYTYKGQSGGNYVYEITLKLYRDCYAPPGSAQLDQQVTIGIFQKDASGNATGAPKTFDV